MKTAKRLTLLLVTGALVTTGVACEEINEFETEPPVRSRLFERTDRVFEDKDDLKQCFVNRNDIEDRLKAISDFRGLDLSNNEIDDIIDRAIERTGELAQGTDPGDLDDDLNEAIVVEAAGLVGLLGTNNSLLLDLTQSPRQGRDDADKIGFPDREKGPLFGTEECSPATKIWSGGYYKRTSMPKTMGEWCEDYGFEADCQTGDAQIIEATGEDLQVSYFNAHALPVFRITLCNNGDAVRKEKGFDGVGFACVNLNYICPQRVKPGIITAEALGKVVGETPGTPEFFRAVNEAGFGVRDNFSDELDTADDDFGVICNNPEEDANCQRCEAVSVTMHYDFPQEDDPKPVVVFGAYRGVGADAELMDRIDLNFSGIEEPFETIPNICNSCHGGDPYEPVDPANPTFDDVNIQSQFLPINFRFALRDAVELKTYLDGGLDFFDALMTIEPRAEEENDIALAFNDFNQGVPFRRDVSGDLPDTARINEFIQLIRPLEYNRFALEGLNDAFGPAIADKDQDTLEGLELHDDDIEIPDTWDNNQDRRRFYKILAEHCNDGCHIAMPPPLDFQKYDSFIEYRDLILRDVCEDYSMPHSPEAFFLFWSRSERATSDNKRLNKDEDGELVPVAERAGRDDLIGDVEFFLNYKDEGWDPLVNDLENGLDDCPVPPSVATFIGAVEITNWLGLEKKREECIAEMLDLDARDGRLACTELCSPAIFSAASNPFTESAEVTERVCDNLIDALKGVNNVKDLFDPREEADDIDRTKLLTVSSFFTKEAGEK